MYLMQGMLCEMQKDSQIKTSGLQGGNRTQNNTIHGLLMNITKKER